MNQNLKKAEIHPRAYSGETRLQPWKTVSVSVRQVNPYWTYKIDRFVLPDGYEGEYHYVHSAGSVFLIPLLKNGRLLMVRQYRYLNRRVSLEFPGGGMRPGESAEETARKELIEETGFTGDLEKIGEFNPFNGVTDETTVVFLARNLSPSSEFHRDESEDFELFELPPARFEDLIRQGEIFDGMTLAAWMLGKDRLTSTTTGD
ncbi:MAG: NUDIX hydrolase [FCB group bacterium]|nr:NUDIX hydrolase [FCB group bacterium]